MSTCTGATGASAAGGAAGGGATGGGAGGCVSDTGGSFFFCFAGGAGAGDPASAFSRRGNSGSTVPSAAPGSSRPHARSAGVGSPDRPSMAKMRPEATGITGDTSTAIRRTASISRYRNASSSPRRAGSLASVQGSTATMRWFSCVIQAHSSDSAPTQSSCS